MEVSHCRGFLLDRWGGRREKGDMSFLRALRVSAIVVVTAPLGLACGDDGEGASGFSAGSLTDPSGFSSSGGTSNPTGNATSTGAVTTSGETTDSPTGSVTTTAAESSSSEPGTTTTASTTDASTSSDEGSSSSSTTNATNGAMCGNGAIDGNEQCDGANLNGFTCEALGNAGGSLQCDPVTCTFDTQLCEGGGGTSG